MKIRFSLAASAVAFAILFTSCDLLTPKDESAKAAPNITTADQATKDKYTIADRALGGALSQLSAVLSNNSYVTVNQTTGVATVNYPVTNGMGVQGTYRATQAANGNITMTMDLNLSFSSANDGYDNLVTGSMSLKSTTEMTSQGALVSGSAKTVGSCTVAFASGGTSTIALDTTSTGMADGSSTYTGTVTIDGKKYSINETYAGTNASVLRALIRR